MASGFPVVEISKTPDGTAFGRSDPASLPILHDDRLDFDAWLLPPPIPIGFEAFVQRLSLVSGPLLLLGSVCVLAKVLIAAI